MPDSNDFSLRADRYVRGDLEPSAIADFEAELLESPELQDAVELALGLKLLVGSGHRQAVPNPVARLEQRKPSFQGEVQWYRWGLAATILLTVATTQLYWRADNRNEELQKVVDQLNQPVGKVFAVPLDIMRSARSESPDVIIRKPAQDSVMILDIELQPDMARSSLIRLTISSISGEVIHSLDTAPAANGRVQIALNTAAISSGQYHLEIDSDIANRVDQRMFELLPADQ